MAFLSTITYDEVIKTLEDKKLSYWIFNFFWFPHCLASNVNFDSKKKNVEQLIFVVPVIASVTILHCCCSWFDKNTWNKLLCRSINRACLCSVDDLSPRGDNPWQMGEGERKLSSQSDHCIGPSPLGKWSLQIYIYAVINWFQIAWNKD